MVDAPSTNTTPLESASLPFVGRWNRLISTTNWEKGRIIHQWRAALLDEDTPGTESSDEAWARLVGGVSGQHVGRLRRVHERFGEVHQQYEGLYWSHFQAALEWTDAEMWLEGAVQDGWSVSQMRAQRWDALGAPADRKPRDEDVISSEADEDVDAGLDSMPETIRQGVGVARDVDGREEIDDQERDGADAEKRTGQPRSSTPRNRASSEAADDRETRGESAAPVRPFADLAALPDDLTEAFESFKLAILRHKMDHWRQVTRDEVLATLDALKELALAPAADN